MPEGDLEGGSRPGAVRSGAREGANIGERGVASAASTSGSGHKAGWARLSGSRRPDASAVLLDAIFPQEETLVSESGPGADLQSVLTDALQGLVAKTGADHACCWMRRADGSVFTPVAHRRRGDALGAQATHMTRLCALPRASDLGGSGMPAELVALARDAGLGAAVPLRRRPGSREAEHDVVGVVLAGIPDEPPGAVRPRTLALLDEMADRLCGPLAAADALARIDRLDGAVLRLDRLATLGDLLTEVVHEVRNPLVSMKTFLQLLPQRRDDPEFCEDFRQVVGEEVSRLERLLDSVLRFGTGRPERASEAMGVGGAAPAPVFEAIAQLVAHRARERRVELLHSVDARGLEAIISPDALHQVVLNLTLNALDASPPNGRVRLEAGVSASSEGRWLRLVVEDEGDGVPVEERERIFEAFHSSRDDRPGGLGLAISRRLVEESGGRIMVEAATGGGARFVVELPARTAQRR